MSMWTTVPLPRPGRIVVITVVVAALIAHGVIDLSAGTLTLRSYIDVGMLTAFAAFAWHPLLAALCLMLGGAIGTLLSIGAPDMLALAIATGLVIYTCQRWFAAFYCLFTAVMTAASEFVLHGVSSGGSVGILAIGIASGSVGSSLIRSHTREQRLTEEVGRLEAETAQAVRAERSRIADELHNIIAHDITIVVMHSRALSLMKESTERDRSVEAISVAARQAMTDIRRMLHIVGRSGNASRESIAIDSESVLGSVKRVASELTALGTHVDITIPDSLELSSSIEAALWHLVNECATNIMKHAPHTTSALIRLTLADESVTLEVWNAQTAHTKKSSGSQTGYGLARMADRVSLLGGTFSSGEVHDGWSVTAVLPRR